MNRSEIVDDLAAKLGNLLKNDTELAVNTILDAINSALVAGHRIEIRGFGSFSVTRRPPRTGRNPRNGESVAIPETRVVHFKPGKALRDSVGDALVEDAPARAK
jgi:integration host factor subunit beta